jgi:membrane-bound lytic murein transglycosylase B
MKNILVLLLTALFSLTASATSYLERPEVQQFIKEMDEKYDYNPEKLKHLFSEVEQQDKVIELMKRPAEAKPWYVYRPIFISEQRANDGVTFWREHNDTIREASIRYKVAPEIIVAIIGVETSYGKNVGSFAVFDTLTTLAFDYPPRAAFFRSELVHFLLMTREENINPLEPIGSYAGAMGPPQFISSSYRAYAVDFDDAGQRDLLNNMDDAIVSVANYFHKHGWKPGGLVAVRATVKGDDYTKLLSNEFKEGTRIQKPQKPATFVRDLKSYGVTPEQTIPGDQKVNLIELDVNGKHEYWLTFDNFYTITRYNHSNLYAMVVFELSQMIKKDYDK